MLGIQILTVLPMKLAIFTIPYFRLTKDRPPTESAPLFPSGIFGIDGIGSRYIREEKFSFARSGGRYEQPNACLTLVLNPLTPYRAQFGHQQVYQRKYLMWMRNNIFEIRLCWTHVLDLLDEQTTLSVHMH